MRWNLEFLSARLAGGRAACRTWRGLPRPAAADLYAWSDASSESSTRSSSCSADMGISPAGFQAFPGSMLSRQRPHSDSSCSPMVLRPFYVRSAYEARGGTRTAGVPRMGANSYRELALNVGVLEHRRGLRPPNACGLREVPDDRKGLARRNASPVAIRVRARISVRMRSLSY